MTMTPELKSTYTTDELAAMLDVSRQLIYIGLRNKTIPSIKLNKRFIIPRAAIDEWMRTAGDSKRAA
jgi:excisionase family DNA binding protein